MAAVVLAEHDSGTFGDDALEGVRRLEDEAESEVRQARITETGQHTTCVSARSQTADIWSTSGLSLRLSLWK